MERRIISSIAVAMYNTFIGPNSKIQLKDVRSFIYYNDNGTWRKGPINHNAGGPVEIHSGELAGRDKGCILVGQF